MLTEFRARLVAGQAEHLLLDTMLERFKARGLIKVRGKQVGLALEADLSGLQIELKK